MVVAVDYFTKWAEAEALAIITARQITNFLWKSIICRFGIPESFVTDNGKQFDWSHYRDWCAELKIKTKYSSPGHPQANGQVKATNKTILNILKKRLGNQKGEWAEELPSTLWAYRISVRTPTEETPFSLVYGMEAMIQAEVAVPTYRVQHFDSNSNDERLKENLDFLEGRRSKAVIRNAANKRRVE